MWPHLSVAQHVWPKYWRRHGVLKACGNRKAHRRWRLGSTCGNGRVKHVALASGIARAARNGVRRMSSISGGGRLIIKRQTAGRGSLRKLPAWREA